MERAYIKDLRHRYSYELRPDGDLDAAVRAIAADLEARGLLDRGASTAPRFQPHLTWCRAAVLAPEAILAAARRVAELDASARLTAVTTFGSGRIICLLPELLEPLQQSRAAVIGHIEPGALDPAVHLRPWTPHVTVAYSVPDAARDAALDAVRHSLPLEGRWERAQAWDLDVRPTRCEVDAPCVRRDRDG